MPSTSAAQSLPQLQVPTRVGSYYSESYLLLRTVRVEVRNNQCALNSDKIQPVLCALPVTSVRASIAGTISP